MPGPTARREPRATARTHTASVRIPDVVAGNVRIPAVAGHPARGRCPARAPPAISTGTRAFQVLPCRRHVRLPRLRPQPALARSLSLRSDCAPAARRRHDPRHLGRRVPHRQAARRRRHGPRLQGRASADRQPRRGEGAVARVRRSRRPRRAVLLRGPRGQPHPPREHRQRARSGPAPRRPSVHHHGVPRRRAAGRPRREARPAAARRPGAPDGRGPRRPRRRPCQGHRPPRSQARQHLRDAGRPAQGARLRHRQAAPRAGRLGDADRVAPRHAALHVAGAGARQAGRPAHRHLRDGRDPVRVRDRAEAVQRRVAVRSAAQAHRRGAAAAAPAAPGHAAADGAGDPARAGQGSQPAVRLGRRAGPGADGVDAAARPRRVDHGVAVEPGADGLSGWRRRVDADPGELAGPDADAAAGRADHAGRAADDARRDADAALPGRAR
jgi:hypothetical protein